MGQRSFEIYLVHEHPEIRNLIWNDWSTVDYVINSSSHVNSWIKMGIVVCFVFLLSLVVSFFLTIFYNYLVKWIKKLKK